MRIAIDIQPLQTATTTDGFDAYLRNVIQYLHSIDSDNEYTFLLNNSAHLANNGAPSSVCKKHYVTRRQCIGRSWWSWDTVHLPTGFIKKDIDIFHYNSLSEFERMIPPTPFGKHRVVATIHDLSPWKFSERLAPHTRAARRSLAYNAKLRYLKHVDAIITLSESVKQDMIADFHVPEERIVVAPYGVSPHFRHPPASQKLEQFLRAYHLPETYILYDGGYASRRKNLKRLLQAYKHVRQILPDAPALLLAGVSQATYRQCIFPLLRDLDLALSVLHLSAIPDCERPFLYHAAALLVYPSLYESFSLAVVYALACGTPVAASQTSVFPELVGQAGCLFDPRDVESMAESIAAGLTDSVRRVRWQDNGPKQAARFSWKRSARTILDVYNRVHA